MRESPARNNSWYPGKWHQRHPGLQNILRCGDVESRHLSVRLGDKVEREGETRPTPFPGRTHKDLKKFGY